MFCHTCPIHPIRKGSPKGRWFVKDVDYCLVHHMTISYYFKVAGLGGFGSKS